ncbi:MAG: DUF294 nucleotidyltransferase-like domain-containing protein [Betaproteobacteria bacterium]
MTTQHQLQESANTAMRQLGRARMTALIGQMIVRHPPLNRFSQKAIDFIAAQAEQVFFPQQTDILTQQSGTAGYLYILEQGKVRRRAPEDPGSELEPGACFPISALAAGLATDASYTAIENCFCYRLTAEDFHRLIAISPEFGEYCTQHLASLLTRARQGLEIIAARHGSEQRLLHAPLSTVCLRPPVTVMPDAPIREALATMASQRIGAMVVTDEEARPVGAFTRSDLLERVVLAGLPLESPIAGVMSSRPCVLREDATVHDAMLAMATRKLRHVFVSDTEGRIAGVVSERDLFALQQSGPWQIRQSIEAAGDMEGLQRTAGEVRQLAHSMLAQGIASPQLTQFISALNDALTCRVLELNLERHDLYGIDWCWLAFGSEGRGEQTFSTDQDNGIVFVCDDFSDRDQLKLRLTEFAAAVNADLDRVGFPLCQGNIMAGNMEWCLTIEEWEERFTTWVRSPEPAALLNAAIFFDFRPLYGHAELAERLRRHLLQLTTTTPLFLKAMVMNALEVEPPLATFRDFRTDLEPEHPGMIDLKKYGARIFVDAARILALATGVRNTNTAQRLRFSADRLNARSEEIEAAIEAFNFIQLQRLHRPDAAPTNLVAPDELNELDRRILKESFRQAKKLQLRLKLDYQTG